jgi:hypothetical protein
VGRRSIGLRIENSGKSSKKVQERFKGFKKFKRFKKGSRKFKGLRCN